MKSLAAVAFLLAAAAVAVAGEPDELLATLKDQNPGAYSIVKALLAKKKMGVLDPRHPTASFAVPFDQEETVPDSKAFDKFMPPVAPVKAAAEFAPAEVASAESAASVPSNDHHKLRDWFGWKPASEAEDTEVMSVLDNVEQLTGRTVAGSGRKHLRYVEQKEAAPVAGGAPSPAKSLETPGSLSSSLDWLQAPDFGGSKLASAKAAPVRAHAGNAYLADLGLSDFSSTSLAVAAARPAQTEAAEKPKKASEPVASAMAEPSDEQSMFEAALGLNRHSAVASTSDGATAEKPARRTPSSNPYLADLGLKKTDEDKDIGSSPNPYLTALGLTKSRDSKMVEQPAPSRRPKQSRDEDNPYLQGLNLDLDKAVSLSSLKQSSGHESEDRDEPTAQTDLDNPWKDKLSIWLNSKRNGA